MESDELKYWVAFSRIPGIGRVRFKLLESFFGSLREAWEAHAGPLKAAGLDSRTIGSITSRRPKVDPDEELSRIVESDIQALTWHDDAFPSRLKEIYDVPPVLYVKGSLLSEDERSVAVVGTRRPTAYGRQVAHRLTYDIANAGVTIVSGLARGIDAIAHKAALDAGHRTIAVMGSGIDVIYPREHDLLAEQIVERGALVSEHPMGTRPDSKNFPRRNRILSGMTLGTVVIEAGETSGALITARHSNDENREVFAVPGNIFSPGSSGTNRLIKDGSAKLVSNFTDVLEELNLTSVGSQIEMVALFPEDETESEVLRYVSYDPIHIDEVIRESELGISTVSSALAMMELKGIVKQVGGMNYIRIREAPAEYQTVV
ncbi:MAG: DNA-protecting protein DprA [Chloroflexi bacterium]|nr:DNA-protecting protein DprA [Chloroflexota bacterium]